MGIGLYIFEPMKPKYFNFDYDLALWLENYALMKDLHQVDVVEAALYEYLKKNKIGDTAKDRMLSSWKLKYEHKLEQAEL